MDAVTTLPPVTLDNLPLETPARIVAVDWAALVAEEAQRLRALGIDVGARITVAHRGSGPGAILWPSWSGA